MNETIKLRLPDETVNYLQRLDYEIGGLQVLHTHALNAGLPLEKRMELRQELQAVYAEYQLAKQEMWAEFAPRFPNFRRWWVDFQDGMLHVEAAGNPTGVGRDDHIAPGTTEMPRGARAEADTGRGGVESPRHAADGGAALVSPVGSVGDGRSPLETIAPLTRGAEWRDDPRGPRKARLRAVAALGRPNAIAPRPTANGGETQGRGESPRPTQGEVDGDA